MTFSKCHTEKVIFFSTQPSNSKKEEMGSGLVNESGVFNQCRTYVVVTVPSLHTLYLFGLERLHHAVLKEWF